MIFVLALATSASLLFLLYTILIQNVEEDTVLSRLKQLGYTEEGKPLSVEEQELAKPFQERIIKPVVESLSAKISRLAPQNFLDQIQMKLTRAGNPKNMTPGQFMLMQIGCALGFPAALAGLMVLGKASATNSVMITGIGLLFGLLYPNMWLNGQITRRQKAVQKQLADVIDLLVVCVEAGLGFDIAMGKVVEKMSGPLPQEFSRVISETRLGRPRARALKDMAERVGLDDLSDFVGAIVQADQLGVSIAKVLRIQSDQLRTRRRQRAEAMAQKAAVKIVFPVGCFILPTIFLIIFGPIGLEIYYSFKK